MPVIDVRKPPVVADDLDATLDAAFGPADDFARELERRGVAVHAAAQVLSPADFDRLVIGTGWVR